MDTSALLAKIHLSQPQAQLLKTGDPASVAVPACPTPFPAKSISSAPLSILAVPPSKSGFRLENPKGTLRPGAAVHVSIAGRTAPKAVVVPSESIVIASSGKSTVMSLAPTALPTRPPWKPASPMRV